MSPVPTVKLGVEPVDTVQLKEFELTADGLLILTNHLAMFLGKPNIDVLMVVVVTAVQAEEDKLTVNDVPTRPTTSGGAA